MARGVTAGRFTLGFAAAAAGLLGLCAGPAGASDLRVTLSLEHKTFLQMEPINAMVAVHNAGNRTVVVGEEPDEATLTFLVERHRLQPIRPRRADPLVRRLEIRPDETRQALVELSAFYPVQQAGSYSLQAAVRLGKQSFASRKVVIDVVSGIELARVQRTLPDYEDRVRVYTLRYWPRDGHEQLFLRVDEPNANLNVGVFPLGQLVRANKPAIKVNRAGRVLIVHQSGTDHFTRTIFQSDPIEVRFLDQTYHRADGSPYVSARDREEAILKEDAAKAAAKKPRRWWWPWPRPKPKKPKPLPGSPSVPNFGTAPSAPQE